MDSRWAMLSGGALANCWAMYALTLAAARSRRASALTSSEALTALRFTRPTRDLALPTSARYGDAGGEMSVDIRWGTFDDATGNHC